MNPAQKKALQALAKNRAHAELKALFAIIRRESDAALLNAVKQEPAAKKAGGESLVRDIARMLAPILAPAAEKADMLVAHMARLHETAPVFEPKGLADAVKKLRTRFKDAEIRAGAASLIEKLKRDFSTRESVS